MRPTPLALALVSALSLPLAAQTTAHKPTTAAHRPVRAAAPSKCAIPLPAISPKIPALPATAPKCATGQLTMTWVDIEQGTGEEAKPRQFYSVRYTGWLPDGTKFDSSDDHPGGEPFTFPYGAKRVITGWDIGFEGMRVGGKRRLFVPYQLAYGVTGGGPIPPRSMLIFDVELTRQTDPAVLQQQMQDLQKQQQNKPATPTQPAGTPPPTTPPAGSQPATPGIAQPPAGAATPNPAAANPAANPTTDPTKPTASPKQQ